MSIQTDQLQPPSPAHRDRDRFERVATQALTAAASSLGLHPSQLKQQLDAGRSVADVAREMGVILTSVVEKMKRAIKRAWPRSGAEQVQWLLDRLVFHRSLSVMPG
jgi:hypothetical protein